MRTSGSAPNGKSLRRYLREATFCLSPGWLVRTIREDLGVTLVVFFMLIIVVFFSFSTAQQFLQHIFKRVTFGHFENFKLFGFTLFILTNWLCHSSENLPIFSLIVDLIAVDSIWI